MTQFVKGKICKPAGSLFRKHGQFVQRVENNSGAGFVKIKTTICQHDWKKSTGYRPQFPWQPAALAGFGFAAFLPQTGCIFVQKIKVIRRAPAYLPGQKRHGEGLVRTLRAATIKAVRAIIVIKPAITPVQNFFFGKNRTPFFQIIPEPIFLVFFHGTNLMVNRAARKSFARDNPEFL